MLSKNKIQQLTFYDSDDDQQKSDPIPTQQKIYKPGGVKQFKQHDLYSSNSIVPNFFQQQQEYSQFISTVTPAIKKIISTNLELNTKIPMIKIMDFSDQEEISQIPQKKQQSIDQSLIFNPEQDLNDKQNQLQQQWQNKLPPFTSPNLQKDVIKYQKKPVSKRVKNKTQLKSQKWWHIKSNQVKDKKQFVLETVSLQAMIRLNIKRDKSGFNRFWPQYDASFAIDCKHLISMKKKSGSTTANFCLSIQPDSFEKGNNLVGKCRSNFTGSLYNIFDWGNNPTKNQNNQKVRKLLSTVIFLENAIDSSTFPKQFFVYMVKPPYHYLDLQGIDPRFQEISLDKLYQIESNQDRIYRFKNRQPIWCKEVQGYIMDFSGRINKPSIKNFILEDENGQQVLMFGKIGDDLFTCDISFPLNVVIAMGIIASTFDSKISVQ